MKDVLSDLMKHAQQMQQNMQKMQDDLAHKRVEGESGAGMVKVTMTGRHKVKKVWIDPSLLQEEKDILEDLLAAAFNNAHAGVDALNKDGMSSLTGGLPPFDLSSLVK